MDDGIVAFLSLIDGSRWVQVDLPRHRLFVWHAGKTSVRVYSTDTAAELDDWPCDPSAESAAHVVAERINQGY